MSTLAERIALRKAATSKPAVVEATVAVEEKKISPSAVVEEMETLVKKEPVIQVGKSLSFAEKMHLKRQLALQGASSSQEVESVPTPTAPSSTEPVPAPTATTLPAKVQSKVQASILSVLQDAIEEDDLEREEYLKAPEEVKQGYRDIKGRVLSLGGTGDDDLAGAMTELKKALLSNPNACLLMLDEDIGKMTIALRRLTQEALVEGKAAKAKKEPGTRTKKTTQVALTAEQMQKVFDEL